MVEVPARAGSAFTLPRKQRLRGSEFQSVFQERGRRVERVSFVAIWRAREGGGRVGFAVGRRIGGAVVRNRGRRRLREAYRRLGQARSTGFDVVFVGRAGLLACSFADLCKDVELAARAIGRLAAEGVRGGKQSARD